MTTNRNWILLFVMAALFILISSPIKIKAENKSCSIIKATGSVVFQSCKIQELPLGQPTVLNLTIRKNKKILFCKTTIQFLASAHQCIKEQFNLTISHYKNGHPKGLGGGATRIDFTNGSIWEIDLSLNYGKFEVYKVGPPGSQPFAREVR